MSIEAQGKAGRVTRWRALPVDIWGLGYTILMAVLQEYPWNENEYRETPLTGSFRLKKGDHRRLWEHQVQSARMSWLHDLVNERTSGMVSMSLELWSILARIFTQVVEERPSAVEVYQAFSQKEASNQKLWTWNTDPKEDNPQGEAELPDSSTTQEATAEG
jgi:serine/threonine protein kinase